MLFYTKICDSIGFYKILRKVKNNMLITSDIIKRVCEAIEV